MLQNFEKNFIKQIKIILTNQESYIFNRGKTSKLKKGTRQGGPISGYLSILVLEVLFAVIKSNKKINCLKIFEHKFLYGAYANDTMFFLKNQKSVIEVLKVFDRFLKVSGLKNWY